jgi:transcriptional regulator with XRE-family HTH domain
MSPTELASAASISVPYASQLLSGKRGASVETAFRVYDATGLQFGPLVNLSPADIEMQRKLIEKAAA